MATSFRFVLPEISKRNTVMEHPENTNKLGNLVLSPGARRIIPHPDLVNAIRRHLRTGPNVTHSLISYRGRIRNPSGCRLLSVHRTCQKQSFLVITEADHSCTRVLLPQEF